MKKSIVFLFFFIGFYITAIGQNCGDNFLGTKTLYKSNNQKYTDAPAGYSPVFINHVGRHGARHLTKEVKTTLAYKLLFEADSAAALTAEGKKLKSILIALQKVEKGSTKFISAEGKDELAGLGTRMYLNYSSLFNGKVHLNEGITKEVRTKQSADAFLSGLKKSLKDSAVVNEYNDDTDLRFYDLSPGYKKFENSIDDSELMLSLQKAARLEEINNRLINGVFLSEFVKKLSESTRAKFVSDLFGFAAVVYSLDAEIKQNGFTADDLDFKSFFTCEELKRLADLDAADENLKKGPGTNSNGIQVRIAVPLLVNFINTTDTFIKDQKYNAELRFAHAETIAPFAALLQISTADKATTNGAELTRAWDAAKVICLGSNIQWVFYKNPDSQNYLVKVLLNEQEVKITGLHTDSFPYYQWRDLRSFYMAKLNKMGVRLTDDMKEYLVNLK